MSLSVLLVYYMYACIYIYMYNYRRITEVDKILLIVETVQLFQ